MLQMVSDALMAANASSLRLYVTTRETALIGATRPVSYAGITARGYTGGLKVFVALMANVSEIRGNIMGLRTAMMGATRPQMCAGKIASKSKVASPAPMANAFWLGGNVTDMSTALMAATRPQMHAGKANFIAA